MKEALVARRWAKAFFAVAVDDGKAEVFSAELANISEALRCVPVLLTALGEEGVPRAKRHAAVDDLAGPLHLTTSTIHLVKLLIDRNRIALLPFLIDAYQRMLEDLRRLSSVDLTVAEASVGSEATERISSILKRLLGRDIRCTLAVDPNIVGGMVVRVGDTIYDGSVRGKLSRMRAELLPGE